MSGCSLFQISLSLRSRAVKLPMRPPDTFSGEGSDICLITPSGIGYYSFSFRGGTSSTLYPRPWKYFARLTMTLSAPPLPMLLIYNAIVFVFCFAAFSAICSSLCSVCPNLPQAPPHSFSIPHKFSAALPFLPAFPHSPPASRPASYPTVPAP